MPGSTPASWRSCTPYLKMPAATRMSSAPVKVKNIDRLIRTAVAYIR